MSTSRNIGNVGGSGSAFPGSPSSGQRFFRTDLGLDCYYDGTRWLTVQQFEVGIGGTDTVLPLGTTNVTVARFAIRQDYQLWLERVVIMTYVTSGNTGSAYWDLAVTRRDTTNTSNSIGTVTTQSDTNANWINKTINVNAALASGTFEIQSVATKTGSPGTLYAPTTLIYRLIVT